MDRVKPQLNELLLGFFDVIPEPLLTVFDFHELELLMCGWPEFEVEDWKEQTKYSGGTSKECQERESEPGAFAIDGINFHRDSEQSSEDYQEYEEQEAAAASVEEGNLDLGLKTSLALTTQSAQLN